MVHLINPSLFLLAISFLMSVSAYGQSAFIKRDERKDKIPLLSADQMKGDFKVLELTLKEFHPGLYRYIEPQELDKKLLEYQTKLKKPMRADKYFSVVAQFLSQIKCYHTYLNPFNQTDKTREMLLGRQTYFPFYFALVDGRMIITRNASAEQVPVGSEVTKINGKSVQNIVKTLLTITHADGNGALANRLNSLELDRSSGPGFALFDIYFPIFFDVTGKLKIDFVDFQTKKKKKILVSAMSKESRTVEMEKRYGVAGSYDEGWNFRITNNKTAVLKMSHFITWKLSFKYKDFLKNAFAEVRSKDAKHLIIDIRGNGGGDDTVADEVFQFLANEVIPCASNFKTLINRAKADPELLKYTTTYEPQIKELLANGLPSSLYRQSNEPGLLEFLGNQNGCKPTSPHELRFEGPVFLLTGAENASAAFSFAYRAKKLGLAKLVGQRTGGSMRGFNGGSYLFATLPNSGFEFDIPLFGYYSVQPQEDEGVRPDVLVERSADDIGIGKDREMAEVERLISISE